MTLSYKNVLKLLFIISASLLYGTVFANYDTRYQQIDALIIKNQQSSKSTENIEIPEYKGDVLTYERLSKIRNVCNLRHELPFEKKKVIGNGGMVAKSKIVSKVISDIFIPEQLKVIMDQKKTDLQTYTISDFTMQGIVYQNNLRWGVVKVPQEIKLLYIRVGQLVGKKYGKITGITKEGISVDEWVFNVKDRTCDKVTVVIH